MKCAVFAGCLALASASLLAQQAAPAKPVLGGRPATVLDPPAVAYAPLLLYDGTWLMKRDNAAPGDKPIHIENDCVRTGAFVVCEQQVAGSKPTLNVFVSAGEPGRYYASPVNADGRPVGRGDLTIDGNLWTFSSQEQENGKTVYYRTINEFSDKNEKITFRVQQSNDGLNWTTNISGIETLLHH